MWICDKCETYNNDHDRICCICSAQRGEQVQVPIRSAAKTLFAPKTDTADSVNTGFREKKKTVATDYCATATKPTEAMPPVSKVKEIPKADPTLKVYGPAKTSMIEPTEYYKNAARKHWRPYYFLRRTIQYGLITANIVVFCQVLYCICRIVGMI